MNSCIIPARGGSEGIKNKNLYPLLGKPLIQWTIEQALRSKVDNVFVSTDDDDIKNISLELGAEIIHRPDKISDSVSSSESALKHAIKEITILKEKKPSLITFLQATSPLRLPDDINNAIDQFYQNSSDSLFSSSVLEDLTLWHKDDGDWASINFDYKNRGRRQELKKNYVENGSIYLFKPEILETFNNRLGGEIDSYIMESWQYHEIDIVSDVQVVEFFMEKNIL
jgi:N-acylneuraminate cytidylyltransferase